MQTTVKTTSELGIESLKAAITYMAKHGKSAFEMDTDGDGEVSTMEIFSYSMALVPTLPGILPVFKSSGSELLDVRGVEFDQLVAHVQATDFLPDEKDRAEKYVKSLFFWLNMNRKFISYSSDFFKGKDVSYNPLDGLV